MENNAENKVSQDVIESRLLYKISDNPPWLMTIFLGLQHYLSMIGSTIAIPLIISPALCIQEDDPAKGILISTIIFVSGIITILQVTFGCRLPIIQGGTAAFLVPTFTILASNFEKCSSIDFNTKTEEEISEIWKERAREIQGAIIVASLFQMIISGTGIMTLLTRWISPLSVVPTICLIGLSLTNVAASYAKGSWAVAVMTVVLLVCFSQCLNKLKIPIPAYNFSKKKLSVIKLRLFDLFPILMGIVVAWLICTILTVSGAFPPNYPARVDTRLNILAKAPWLYVPYPFQFGIPTVSASSVIGMIAGVVASMIESVGDYYACARICDTSSPTSSAINRGLFIEGTGGLIAGLFGSCNGTTSYSDNIGVLKISRVASRRVIQVSAVIMIIFGIIGKFGALCATIPDPVLGGIFMIVYSLIAAVGISNLQLVDLNSARNLLVLGLTLFIGLMLPGYIQENKEQISTGNESIDQIIIILLSTSMLIGGVLGILLDNILPGTLEERGMHKWNKREPQLESEISIYDLPFGMNFIKRHTIFKKIPISPTFKKSC